MTIDHKTLQEIINYNPESGIFTWARPRPKIQVGSRVGYLHHRGYRNLEIDGKHYSEHRLAWFYMTGKWPKDQIDHINGNRSDNRFENLREATNGQNRANSKTSNAFGLKGISFKKKLKKTPWQATIRHNRKTIYIGCFRTPEEAHAAYTKKAAELHGEFFNPSLAAGGIAKS
jgi:hypothetical protein